MFLPPCILVGVFTISIAHVIRSKVANYAQIIVECRPVTMESVCGGVNPGGGGVNPGGGGHSGLNGYRLPKGRTERKR